MYSFVTHISKLEPMHKKNQNDTFGRNDILTLAKKFNTIKMNQTQEKLNELYDSYLEKVLSNKEISNYILNDTISSPLFINLDLSSNNYIESDVKILYVGKENNGWFGFNERNVYGMNNDIFEKEKYLNSLLDLYGRFELGKKYQKPFFLFKDILAEKIEERNYKVGVLWSNLLRFDCQNKWELKKKVFEIDGNEILKKEIEILKPNLIVFVTGPNYDYFIDKTFIENEYIQINNKPIREKCIIKHQNLPRNTFRIYHPDYQLRLGKNYRWDIVDEIVKLSVF